MALRATAFRAAGFRALARTERLRAPALFFFAYFGAVLFAALRLAVIRPAARFRFTDPRLSAAFRRVVPAALRLAIAVVLSVPTYLDCCR
jgi:hypothetical protein